MDAHAKKTTPSRSAQGRVRGVLLSSQGWQRFQKAKQQAEGEASWGKRFTKEELSHRTGLSLNTLARIFKRELGVDRQSLELLFRTFELELAPNDLVSPAAPPKTLDDHRENPQQDWDNAIDASVFYGRETELAQLRQWIVCDYCRLVGVLGIGGIGKSSIAVKAALQMQDEFEIVVWRSLANAPPLGELLSSLLKFFMPIQEKDPVIPNTLSEKLSQVIQYLRSRRCLVILDNTETILHSEKVGQYRSGYEDYGQCLRTLGETSHKSCLLLTSREKPWDITLMEGEQTTVKTMLLGGLTSDNGRAIFRQKGSFVGSEAQWQTLSNYYGGNPLALKLVAAATQDLFDGNIADVLSYLEQGISVFEDIDDILGCQFERLSDDEQQALTWLAIHREPVSIAELSENLINVSARHSLPRQLSSLLRRSLLEKIDGLFFLQPVVMEYVTKRLIQQICTEFETQEIAVLRSHTLIRMQSKDYVREIQTRLIVQPILDRLLLKLGNVANIEARSQQILATQRQRCR